MKERRAIKFRAWDGATMHYDIRVDASGSWTRLKPGQSGFAIQYDPTYETIADVMQYTGLKDKNEKEIYEGDIVHNYWHNIEGDIGGDWEVCFGEHETSSDYYASTAYGWYVKTKVSETNTLINLPSDGHNNIEVIGNIYEGIKDEIHNQKKED